MKSKSRKVLSIVELSLRIAAVAFALSALMVRLFDRDDDAPAA